MADRYEWERDRHNDWDRGENRSRYDQDRRREFAEREGPEDRDRQRYGMTEGRYEQQGNEGRYGEGRYGQREFEGRYEPRNEGRYEPRNDVRYGPPAYEGRYGQPGYQGGYRGEPVNPNYADYGERGSDWSRQGSSFGRSYQSNQSQPPSTTGRAEFRPYGGNAQGNSGEYYGGSYQGGESYLGGSGSLGGGMSGYGQTGHHIGRGPKGWRRSDDRIHEDINQRLTDHPHLDASEIEVQVKNGEVTLAGTVDDRHAKRMAEDIAEGVSGVHQVHNQIRVQHQAGQVQDQGQKAGAAGSAAGTARK